MSTNHQAHGFAKTIRLYLKHEEKEPEPYPINFYPGTHPNDINLMINEALNDLKIHSKNEKLKFWNRPDAEEIHSQETLYHKLTSIVISEHQPFKAYLDPPHRLQKRSTNLANQSTVNATPADSQDPLSETSSSSPVKEKDALIPKKIKSVGHQRKSSGPIVEKVIQSPSSPTSFRRPRTRSAAKSLLMNHKPQAQHIARPLNEISFLPRSDSSKAVVSHERIDTSLTFNPNKFLGGGELHANSLVSMNKTRRDHFSSQHQVLNESQSQSLYEENKNEESSLGKSDSKSPKRSIHFQSQLDGLMKTQRIAPVYHTGNVAVASRDGNDQHIYSFQKGVSPFSYFIATSLETTYNPKLPPPTYMPYQILSSKKPFEKEEIFRGLEILPNGELKLVDPEILKQQKGIIGEVLQSLLKSLAEGRGIVGVSLPVRIFEPRSLLERVCDWWTFIPNFVVPAAKSNDPVTRMKAVIAAAIGGLYVSAKQLKPFNPLLGETFQAVFPQHNIQIFIEHTSHHPPIANFLLTHKDFKFWGRYEFFAKLEGLTRNTVILHQQGPNYVDFSDGNRITFHLPHLHIEGLTHGDRTCKYVGNLTFVDEKNRIKTVIQMGETGETKKSAKKRTDAFYGKIFRFRQSTGTSPSKKKSAKGNDANYQDLEEDICTISGSWLESLKADDQELWNINKNIPTQYVPVENPLPSDSRFREDLLWVKKDNKKHAHEWKLKLEERQRFEKKLRTDYSKKHKKH